MPKKHGSWYTLLFATVMCLICASAVSSIAVLFKPMQTENQEIDKKRNVLLAAGIIEAEDESDSTEISRIFEESAKESRDKKGQVVYTIFDRGELDMIVIPVEGKGLWSTLYGFLAIDSDTTTIRGISFYKHGETPGLGGEVDNPAWKARWVGRKAFDDRFEPVIKVIKGKAGTPEEDPHKVDGLSGATMTSNGVTELVRKGLGEKGYGDYLASIRAKGGQK